MTPVFRQCLSVLALLLVTAAGLPAWAAGPTTKDAREKTPAAGPDAKKAPGKEVEEKSAMPPPVDLNTATDKELMEIPGVGEAYTAKIIADRPYASLDELKKAGLPQATIDKLKPYVIMSKMDLNTATAEQLQTLPGVAEGYAKKIVAGRPYKTVDDVKAAGVPAATLEKFRMYVTARQAGATQKAGPVEKGGAAEKGAKK